MTWRSRAGLPTEPAADLPEPFSAELTSNGIGASAFWDRERCPYDAALSRAGADEEEALRQALAQLQALNATPAAAIVARRLRERGVRKVPRGPRKATRRNPGQLTARELEVLTLVAQGLHNREIATACTCLSGPLTRTCRRSCASSTHGRGGRPAWKPPASGWSRKIGNERVDKLRRSADPPHGPCWDGWRRSDPRARNARK